MNPHSPFHSFTARRRMVLRWGLLMAPHIRAQLVPESLTSPLSHLFSALAAAVSPLYLLLPATGPSIPYSSSTSLNQQPLFLNSTKLLASLNRPPILSVPTHCHGPKRSIWGGLDGQGYCQRVQIRRSSSGRYCQLYRTVLCENVPRSQICSLTLCEVSIYLRIVQLKTGTYLQ